MTNHMHRKIGILGGTFDPIHMIHLHMAEVAREECGLDEIWFLPAHQPPHKEDKTISSGHDRIEMIQRAIKGIPYFKLLLTEFEREGPSYTYDTMKQLQAHNPQVSFFFIIGADMMHYLPKWVKIKELMQMVTFIGVRRPGWHISTNHDPYTKQVQLIDMLISPLSSTEIRERKRKGKSIRFLVPEPVYQYIEERQLYES